MPAMQHIAVIGAGAAGLCAARHISHSKHFTATVFEATDHVGGTWYYTDLIEKDENGYTVHSSMYKDLRTNLPKQVMAFPDLPFDESLPSFLSHTDVLDYLKQYSNNFNLNQHIQFNTLVDEVKPVSSQEQNDFPKWEVTTLDWKSKLRETNIFDGVMVCCGHYSVPCLPIIRNLDKYEGKVMHSHHYRTPDTFENKRIVMIGAMSSGTDIALSLCKVADSVVLSYRGPRLHSPLPENLTHAPFVCSATPTGVVFEDGSSTDCDCIMFCTGYNYDFPFFKDSRVVQVMKNRITPLYKHLINIKYPNLSFIGFCRLICPFPQFHCQVLVALGAIEGSVKLPSTDKMLEDEETDYRKRLKDGVLPHRGAHILADEQWQYNDDLADLAGKPRIHENVRLLYGLCHQRRTVALQSYKADEFVLSENGHYRRCKDPN